jgi:hypothetical protein
MRGCIARSGLYFPHNAGRCNQDIIVLPKFFIHSADGDLNAYICTKHAYEYELTRNFKSYLYGAIVKAKAQKGAEVTHA